MGLATEDRRTAPSGRIWLSLAAAVLGAAAVVAWQPDPVMVIVSPKDGSPVAGQTGFEVRFDPPGTEIRSLNLYADGRLICTLERAPFECTWDAGPKVVAHDLRAVAVTSGGRRLASRIRTVGFAHTEGVDVDVVHITASVVDGGGHFVRGLKSDAFRVAEEKVPQQITHFDAENVPLEIIVAVDVSGSMRDAMAQAKEAVKRFLVALRPDDRVTLMAFNDNPIMLARPSVDLAGRLRAVDRLAPWGGTSLYDMIVQAIEQLGRQPGRHVLVAFTDGEDRDSFVSIDVAERRLDASDVVFYPIGQGRAAKVRDLKRVLERLAHKSGGRASFVEMDKLDRTFAGIVEELSNQYLLGFVPKDGRRDGRWRNVSVEVPKDYRVRARQGYRLDPR